MNKFDFIIKCIKQNSDNIIENLYIKEKNELEYEFIDKKRFISYILLLKNYGFNFTIKTINGDNVNIVDGKYLRTDGNQIKEDNLANLKECK